MNHPLRPGRYRLQLTVTSTDCAGGTTQTTTIARPVRITRTAWADLAPPRQAPSYPAPYTANCCFTQPTG